MLDLTKFGLGTSTTSAQHQHSTHTAHVQHVQHVRSDRPESSNNTRVQYKRRTNPVPAQCQRREQHRETGSQDLDLHESRRRRHLAFQERCPDLVEFGPKLFDCGPKLVEFGRCRGTNGRSGPKLIEFGPSLVDSGPMKVGSGPILGETSRLSWLIGIARVRGK